MSTMTDVATWRSLATAQVWLREAPLERVQEQKTRREDNAQTGTLLSRGVEKRVASSGQRGELHMNLSKSLWLCSLKIRSRFEFCFAFT